MEFYLVDPEADRIVSSNFHLRSGLGIELEALHQKSVNEILEGFHQPPLADKVAELRQGTIRQLRISGHHIRNDSSRYPVALHLYLTDWHDRKMVAVLALPLNDNQSVTTANTENRLIAEIQSSGKVGGWQLSFPDKTLYWTSETARIYGLSPDTPAPDDCREATTPYSAESQQRIRRYIEQVNVYRQGWSEEFTLTSADGQVKRVHVVARAEVEKGEVIRLFGTIQDLTELRTVQQELASSEQDYQRMVEAAPYGILKVDRNFIIAAANNTATELYGRAAEQLIGTSYINHFRASERAQVVKYLDQAFEGDNEIFDAHTSVGGTHRISAYLLARRKEDQPRLIITCRDVTSAREAANALLASEQKYRFMVDSSPDMVILHDLSGQIIDANPIACEKLGYDRQQLLQMNFAQIDNGWYSKHFSPAQISRWQQNHADSSAETRLSGESALRCRNQSQIPCEYHSTIARLDDKLTVLNYARDISERRRRIKQEQEMQVRVQQSQKLESLGVLAGGIAHDFNNLLTSILGNANLANASLGIHNGAGSYIENIETAAMRAGELCNQMLTYAGHGRFNLEAVNLNQLITDMTRLLELTVSKKTVFKYHLTDHLPLAHADPSQIRQALMNLVINAAEAIGDTSGLITINTGMMRAERHYLTETYLAPDLPEGDYLYIEVSDNGSGMNNAVKNRIFDPFFSTKFTGRGLGLAAVLGIVRSHHGALKVYSELNRGSTFKLLLPLENEPKSGERRAIENQNAQLSGTILIADDEESVAAVTARMVEALGFKAVITENGRRCVEAFKENPADFALVLLDLSMPEMGGEETFRELRLIDPAARVILTSGFNEEDASHRFSGKGLTGFLQKPYNLKELRALISQAIDS